MKFFLSSMYMYIFFLSAWEHETVLELQKLSNMECKVINIECVDKYNIRKSSKNLRTSKVCIINNNRIGSSELYDRSILTDWIRDDLPLNPDEITSNPYNQVKSSRKIFIRAFWNYFERLWCHRCMKMWPISSMIK